MLPFDIPLAKLLGGVSLAMLLATMGVYILYLGEKSDAERAEAALAIATVEISILQKDITLRDKADRERLQDAAEIDSQEQELENANAEEDPNLRTLRNLCVRLQQQNPAAFADNPTCQRLNPGS